ncbi:hypothetical protein SAZ11_46350 [Streptomyces sp. FXJ1.4098]|uniref:hypothetical protein n=1 Tax=Streptomyces sp. NPDC020845 TaxID=3365096 RepID=UPI002996E388|nr:hypothetical protein [Streptomyces sp. FXJ1.4098]
MDSDELAFESNLDQVWRFGRWLAVITSIVIVVVIPFVFGIFDEDRLRMTDDYAAMTSACIAALLLLGFVELHFYLQSAKERIEAEEVRTKNGPGLPVAITAATRTVEEKVALRLTAVVVWMLTAVLLASALTITFLWAAIDGHGAARWAAWYVFLSTEWGLAVVTFAAFTKVLSEINSMILMYRKVCENRSSV